MKINEVMKISNLEEEIRELKSQHQKELKWEDKLNQKLQEENQKLKKELSDVKKDLKLAKQCNNFMKRFDCLNKDCKNYVCVLNNNKKLKEKKK